MYMKCSYCYSRFIEHQHWILPLELLILLWIKYIFIHFIHQLLILIVSLEPQRINITVLHVAAIETLRLYNNNPKIFPCV